MKAIVLVGGFGTRIEEIAQGRPKTLLEVYDEKGVVKPIFEFILDKINDTNKYVKPSEKVIDEIIVVTNEKYYKQMRKACRDYRSKTAKSVDIRLLNDGTTNNENRLGSNGDLQWVKQQMDEKGINYDEVMIIAGDNYFDFDLIDVIDNYDLRTYGSLTPTILVAKTFKPEEMEEAKKGFAMLKLNEQRKVVEMVEKPALKGVEVDSNMGAIALYVMSGKNFSLIDNFMEEFKDDPKAKDALGNFGSYLMKHTPTYAWTWNGTFVDIGTVKAYKDLWKNYKKKFGFDTEISRNLKN